MKMQQKFALKLAANAFTMDEPLLDRANLACVVWKFNCPQPFQQSR